MCSPHMALSRYLPGSAARPGLGAPLHSRCQALPPHHGRPPSLRVAHVASLYVEACTISCDVTERRTVADINRRAAASKPPHRNHRSTTRRNGTTVYGITSRCCTGCAAAPQPHLLPARVSAMGSIRAALPASRPRGPAGCGRRKHVWRRRLCSAAKRAATRICRRTRFGPLG